MDAQKFLDAFGHIANAPGGIARLRELTLQLAVSGRLTSRIDGDTSAHTLLELNAHAKARFEKAGRPKRAHALTALAVKEFPWTVPEGWCWTRLGTVTDYGNTTKSEFDDVFPDTWVLELEDIEKSTSRLIDRKFARERRFKSPKNRFSKGAILYGKLRPYLDKVLIADQDGVCSTEIATISFYEGIEPRYLRWFLKSSFFINYANGSTYGMNLPRMGTESARMAPFAFPPLAEQAQIVAKVDELMTLCDHLEKQQEAGRTLQVKARKALIQSVASAPTSGEVLVGWGKLTDHFAELFSSPEDVEHLRGLILDLAVRGELVPQSAEHESALDWFEQLEGKRTFVGGHVTDTPFELPDGWGFFHLGSLTDKIGSGSTPRGGREVYVRSGVTFLRSQNIWNDGLRLQDVVFILPEVHKKMAGSAVRPKDILLNITGASLGRCALVPEQSDEMNVSQHVTIIRPKDEQIRHYLHLCMLSPYFQSMVWGRQVGMAREGLSKKVLEQFEIPLPPIGEQKRIVARVDELMRLCTKMEEQLHEARSTAEALARAAVSSLIGIASTKEEAELKTPQTELIAPLRIGTPPIGAAQAPLAAILIRHSGALSAKDLWQRFGGEIDSFYAQLKHEVAHGWIVEPEVAEMREQETA